MRTEIKFELKKKARHNQGLLNLLKDDIFCICIDADDFDLFNLRDSISDAKRTVEYINKNLNEMEDILLTIKYDC